MYAFTALPSFYGSTFDLRVAHAADVTDGMSRRSAMMFAAFELLILHNLNYQRKNCSSNILMSCLSKIEMSCLGVGSWPGKHVRSVGDEHQWDDHDVDA